MRSSSGWCQNLLDPKFALFQTFAGPGQIGFTSWGKSAIDCSGKGIKLQRLGTEAECKTAAWRVITGYYRILLTQVPLPKDATLEELQIPEAWGPDSCKKKSIRLIWLNFTHAGTIPHWNILKHTWTQVDVHQTWSLPWLSIGVFICREGETDSKRKFCWGETCQNSVLYALVGRLRWEHGLSRYLRLDCLNSTSCCWHQVSNRQGLHLQLARPQSVVTWWHRST